MNIELKTVLLLIGVSLIVSVPCTLAHTDVTPEQAYELIGSTDALTVIDVREPSEYCGTRGHIPGALNYPWNSGVLHAQYEELPMDSVILVVCQSGGRSNQAATFLDSKGFSMGYDMLGGMGAWVWETESCVEADEKYSGGTGEPDDPYQIATAEDLMLLGESPEDYDKHFILTADINLDPNLPGRKVFDRAIIAPDVNNAERSFQGTAFNGLFDGNGHMISNMTIEGIGYLGLFGQLEPMAEVKNLGVVDVNITGLGHPVGGLVGSNNDSSISTSYSTGIVSGVTSVGCLVGYNGGIITASYSTGTVTGSEEIGGLVGYNNEGSITICYSTGMVSGRANIGGLVGENDGSVITSFSDSTVSGRTVGGLVGYNTYGSITTSYSTGSVIGEGGGLVGDNGGSITSSFWDVETSGLTSSDGGIGLTTAEMQTVSTFIEAGWDFVGETENGTDDIWSICEGTNYPRFVWQIPLVDFVCPDGVTIDDFAFLMEHWLDDNCDSSNGYCDGTDLDQSGTVDVNDLEIFFGNWPAEN
jgi:rhodanese-related sulfurtransferase